MKNEEMVKSCGIRAIKTVAQSAAAAIGHGSRAGRSQLDGGHKCVGAGGHSVAADLRGGTSRAEMR